MHVKKKSPTSVNSTTRKLDKLKRRLDEKKANRRQPRVIFKNEQYEILKGLVEDPSYSILSIVDVCLESDTFDQSKSAIKAMAKAIRKDVELPFIVEED